ncbi:MAG: hypothetical protein ACK4YP_10560 [Myxococcota bacterium]
MATLILLVGGCLWGKGIEGCDSLGDPIAREECRYDAVLKAFDDPAAFDAVLAKIPEDASRDLVLYRLAVDNPSRAEDLCKRTKTKDLGQKCRNVVGRPHLRDQPGP